jgi:hypothetical protein
MLITRLRSLSFSFAGIIVLIAGLLAAQPAAVPDGPPGSPADPNHPGQSVNQARGFKIPITGATLEPCFDVALGEVSKCRNEIKIRIPANGQRLEACFDVPISEKAGCRNAGQSPVR